MANDEIKPKQDNKNPVQSAANKMTDAFNKEWGPKFEVAMKRIAEVDNNIRKAELLAEKEREIKAEEIEKLKELKAEYETAKGNFSRLVKEVA